MVPSMKAIWVKIDSRLCQVFPDVLRPIVVHILLQRGELLPSGGSFETGSGYPALGPGLERGRRRLLPSTVDDHVVGERFKCPA